MQQTRKSSALLAETRLQHHDRHQRQRELRTAALSVVAPMKCRPGHVWNEIARLDRPTRRFDYVQEPLRLAAYHGADVDRIADFYVALFLDCIAAAPAPVTFDAATAGIRAIREQSESMEWQCRSLATGLDCDVLRSERETLETIGACQFYLAAIRRQRALRRIG